MPAAPQKKACMAMRVVITRTTKPSPRSKATIGAPAEGVRTVLWVGLGVLPVVPEVVAAVRGTEEVTSALPGVVGLTGTGGAGGASVTVSVGVVPVK